MLPLATTNDAALTPFMVAVCDAMVPSESVIVTSIVNTLSGSIPGGTLMTLTAGGWLATVTVTLWTSVS